MEDELAKGLRCGDEGKLAEAVELYRPHLERIIRFRMDGKLQDRVEVGDVVQELYLAAAKRLRFFAEHNFQSVLAWLRQVALQTVIDLQRHHLGAQCRDAYREQAYEVGGENTSTCIAMNLSVSGTTPSIKVHKIDMMERVRAVVDEMEPLDREAIALRHFEGLGNKDIAEVLGISVKAASLRYVRALRRLQERLEQAGLALEELSGA